MIVGCCAEKLKQNGPANTIVKLCESDGPWYTATAYDLGF